MCRYGHKTYKPSFVCFLCRKSFKKVAFQDYLTQHPADDKALANLWPYRPVKNRTDDERRADHDRYRKLYREISDRYRRDVGVCPQCAGPMHHLGLDFKPPKQSDVAAWKAVEGALRTGHGFHSCGCDGPGFVPASAAEYRRYLKQRLDEYRRRSETAMTKPDLGERAFWADRVALVEAELAKV